MDCLIRTASGFFLVAALIVACTDTASASYTGTPIAPVGQPYQGTTPGRMMVPVNVNVQSPSRALFAHTRVPLSPSSIGGMARGAVGGPVGVALTALFAAQMYWEWNNERNNWEYKEWHIPEDFPYPNDGNYTITGGVTVCSSNLGVFPSLQSAVSAMNACYGALSQPEHITAIEQVGDGRYRVTLVRDTGSGTRYVNVNRTTQAATNPDDSGYTVEEVTPEMIADALQQHHNMLRDILDDAIKSGSWPDTWPELNTAVQTIVNNYNQGDTHNSTTVPQPTETGTGSVTAGEWPSFCGWASPVCTFIDWFKAETEAPEHPELPIEEPELAEWDSGLGSGGCPAPYTAEFQGQQISYEFTDACWAAENAFRPLLLALSLITAGFIIAGSRAT